MEGRLLSFLGMGNYKKAFYFNREGKGVETSFVCCALTELLKPEGVVVFATEEVMESENAQSLREEMKKRHPEIELTFRKISGGKNQKEIWEIFDAIVETLQEGEKVTIDITHGFRHIPMLSSTIVFYVAEARGVEVERVVYGAYEARDESTSPPRVPIVDLTALIDILKWTYATRQFRRYGISGEMTEIVDRLLRVHSRERVNIQRQIKDINAKLRNLSLALDLGQPLLVGEKAEEVGKAYRDMDIPEQEIFLKPFMYLLKDVVQEYEQFSQEDIGELSEAELLRELELIKWYLEKGHLKEAVQCMREWLVNWRILWAGEREKWLDREERVKAEDYFKRNMRDNPDQTGVVLYDKISQLRNKIAHAGFAPSPLSLRKVRIQASRYYKELRGLFDGEFGET